MLFDVTYVKAKPDFSMIIEFENGEKKCFDMKPYMDQKPWLRLKEGNAFMKAYVLNGTVAWPGNFDIDPETLYERSARMAKEGIENRR